MKALAFKINYHFSHESEGAQLKSHESVPYEIS